MVMMEIYFLPEENIKEFGKKEKIHELHIEDVLEKDIYPKYEKTKKYSFLVLAYIDRRLITKISIFIFKKKIAIVGRNAKVLERMKKTLSKTKDIFSILSFFIKGLERTQHFFEIKVGDEEVRMMKEKNYDIENLLDLRKTIAEYSYFSKTNKLAIMRMLIKEKNNPKVQNIFDALEEFQNELSILKENIDSLIQLYLAIISNKTNEIMKTLTIITTIMLPLSLITGIYGMNFKYMPELYHPLGYPIVLLMMFFIAVGLLFYFKKRGWL